MSIQLENETKVDYYHYDINGLTKEDFIRLRNYGLSEIKKDDVELVNYALNKILRDMINTTSKDLNKMKQLLQKNKQSIDK